MLSLLQIFVSKSSGSSLQEVALAPCDPTTTCAFLRDPSSKCPSFATSNSTLEMMSSSTESSSFQTLESASSFQPFFLELRGPGPASAAALALPARTSSRPEGGGGSDVECLKTETFWRFASLQISMAQSGNANVSLAAGEETIVAAELLLLGSRSMHATLEPQISGQLVKESQTGGVGKQREYLSMWRARDQPGLLLVVGASGA